MCLPFILANKLVFCLITALAVFGISTISLSVVNQQINNDLDDCRQALDNISTTTTTISTTITTPAPTTQPPPPTTTTPPTVDMSKYRLSTSVTPASYQLYLAPDFNTGKFGGEVVITVNVTENVDSIVLHSNKLTIEGVEVDGANGTFIVDTTFELLEVFGNGVVSAGEHVVKVVFSGNMTNRIVGLYQSTYTNEQREISYMGEVTITLHIDSLVARNSILLHSGNLSIDAVDLMHLNTSKAIGVQNVLENQTDEVIRVVTKQRLLRGFYKLSLKFGGSMVGKLRGFYRSRYKTQDGRLRNIATSKFEPTYARQAFPCFDEPNMKATYTVRILKPNDSDYTALSNMPETGREQQDNGVVVTFQESVKMSTYLVCFIVSDFTYTEDTIEPDNITFRVYATPQQIEKTNYAKDIGKKVIEYYINYFNISFPLPKLDMAAIPDFVSGAMEHWGLVTFRETALLYTNATHSSANKQRVATVVAHELAHSWFGNLVTMNWWNDLWLNEGFASYIEYKGVNFAEPDWKMMDHFLIEDLHSVLSLDATLSSHPIVQTVTTPDEITAIFDTISYNKGAAVLRMLEDAVGPDVFQKSVTNYLNAHSFGNAITQDLLSEIQKITGEGLDVTEFMNTWTVQMGYPVVTVATEGNNYVLRQERFLQDPDSTQAWATSTYKYRWTIPITYITDVNPQPTRFWFNHTDQNLTIPKSSNAAWIKFNYNQVGYYRVNYDSGTWEQLIRYYSSMVVADRTHLLEETFSLALAGQISYAIPLGLTEFLRNETEYVPWSAASAVLKDLKQRLSSSKSLSAFQEYVKDVVDTTYNNLTWDENEQNDTHLVRRARVVVLDLACSMGHSDCLAKASERLTNWLNADNATSLSQDLRSLIYVHGMTAGDSEMWFKLWDKFVAESDASEKLKLLNGLANIRDSSLLQRILTLAEDETYIRSQDYFTCVRYVAANPVGTPIVWDYIRENWENIVNRFGLNDRYLGQLIPAITSSFATQIKLDEMEAFFTKYPMAGAGASQRTKALENIANNMKWLKNYKSAVESWVETRQRTE